MSDICVIMVSYHTGPVLTEAIDAALSQPEIESLIVVDNGNPDGARQQLSERASAEPKLSYIEGHGNIGFGRGCNLGAGQASAPYLLFLNPDAIVQAGAAAALKSALSGRAAPAIAGALLVDSAGAEQRGSRRGVLTARSFLSGFNRHGDPLPKDTALIPTISGAGFMVRREDFDALDGFDPRYFLHVEDIDLCHRARAAGGEVVIAPDAKIMHYGATSDAPRLTVQWHKAKSFVLFFTTHSKGLRKIGAYLCAPFIVAAVMARALLR